jgi:hypothetical protein
MACIVPNAPAHTIYGQIRALMQATVGHCRVGDYAEAAQQWNLCLPLLQKVLQENFQENLQEGLTPLQKATLQSAMLRTLHCMERQDWVGFADVLEYEVLEP